MGQNFIQQVAHVFPSVALETFTSVVLKLVFTEKLTTLQDFTKTDL